MNDIEIPKKNLSDFNVAGLAQLVEHLICNQGARGSNPLAGTTHFRNFYRKAQRPSFLGHT